MENLRRHFTKKKDTYSVIGRVKRNGHCKKHPKHHQSPGVCSLCLREKLTQLSCSDYSRRRSYDDDDDVIINGGGSSTSSSFSSYVSSYYSSGSASSSCASPMHCFCFTNNVGKSSSSVSIFLLSGRSLDIVPRRTASEDGGVDHGYDDDKSAYKSGFWFKLLHPKSKRMKEYCREETKLVHSIRREIMV